MNKQTLHTPLSTEDQKTINRKLLNILFSSILLSFIIISIFIYIGYNEPLVVQVVSFLFAIVFLGVLLPLTTISISGIKSDLKNGIKNVIFGTIDKKITQHSYTEIFRTSRGQTQYYISVSNEGFRVSEKQFLHCAKGDFVALEYTTNSRTVLSIQVTDKDKIKDYTSIENTPNQFSDTVKNETIATKLLGPEELKYLKIKRSNSLSKGLPIAILLGSILFFSIKYALSTFSFTKGVFGASTKGEVLIGCFIFLFVIRKAFRPYIPLTRDVKLGLKNIIKTCNIQKNTSDTKILQHNWQKFKKSNKFYYLKIGKAYVEINQKQYESINKDTFFEVHLTPNYRAMLLIEWGEFSLSPI